MATDQILTLSSASDSIDLYTWVNKGVGVPGWEALAGVKGFGMTEQVNHWFEGAGDGEVYRGSRVLGREIELPVYAQEKSRAGLNALLSRMSQIMSPDVAPFRLQYGLPGGELWYIDAVRESGGDYVRTTKDSDNRTFLKTVFMLRSGNPYWTRQEPEGFIVTEDKSGRGLLPNLAKLELSYSGAFGNFAINNSGDAKVSPYVTLNGPFTKVTMIGPGGLTLVWTGNILAGQKIFIDMKNGTVRDANGVNRYNGLGLSPKFWQIMPGATNVTVVLENTTSETYALFQWWPRRWAVV